MLRVRIAEIRARGLFKLYDNGLESTWVLALSRTSSQCKIISSQDLYSLVVSSIESIVLIVSLYQLISDSGAAGNMRARFENMAKQEEEVCSL